MAKRPEITETIKILENIRIVLVEPQGAANIGSVARVMANTGFSQLVLVNPVPFHTNESYMAACNAQDILHNAKVFPTLDEAIKHGGPVIGTSRRRGKDRNPHFLLDEALPKILSFGVKNPVSILFGREDRGLEVPELEKCDMLLEIPSHGSYSSLNLSHAVFAVCHNLFSSQVSFAPTQILTDRENVEAMYGALEHMLKLVGYGSVGKGGDWLLRVIMHNSRKLFGRVGLMEKEVRMMRGIFARIEENVNKNKDKDKK